jgi:hypothetical protein
MKRNEIKNLLKKIEQYYTNLDKNKSKIIKDNRKKSGVYLLTNIMTQDTYIGSSVNLGLRFKSYFTISHISKPVRSKTIIHRALLKYSYSNFQLEILEYCEPDLCLKRLFLEKEQQYFLNLINPTYNFLTKAGSSKGYKHTIETLENKIRPFLKIHNAKKRLPVQLLNIETNIISKYDSITATAEALKTNEKNVRYAAKHNKLLLKKYKVTIIRNK